MRLNDLNEKRQMIRLRIICRFSFFNDAAHTSQLLSQTLAM